MASKHRITERPGAAAIVAALLLPPLGVYLVRGLAATFWIAVVLTCLGLLPGIVFALATVLAPARQRHGEPALDREMTAT